MSSKRINIQISETALRHALEAIKAAIKTEASLLQQMHNPTPAMSLALIGSKRLNQWAEAEIELALLEATADVG